MASIGGYLSLIDLGMSGSVARLLIDHKDDRKSSAYGSLFKTGWLVLIIQGMFIFLAGFLLAPLLAELLAIPQGLSPEFIKLMRWQTTTLALAFATRIFSHLLQAHQRIDITYYIQLGTLCLNFASLWIFFHCGQGVFSLAWAVLIGTICSAVAALLACRNLKLFPQAGSGSISWHHFSGLFTYGKDLFLVAVGTQLIMASQTMIITRRLGLEAAAAWYAGTRVFNLVNQAIWRVSDVAAPAFSEMIVRGENALLRERYKSVTILSASLSGFAAVGYALCNSAFVWVWTNHKIDWPSSNDVLLGVWMVVMAILHCHNGFVLLTKKIGFMRYIYFLEGMVFVSAACLTAKWGGLRAIIACSVVCSLLFSGAYGIWRVSNFFNLPFREVGLYWLAPMGRVLALFLPVALAGWWGFGLVKNPAIHLALNALLGGMLGSYLFLRHGLSHTFQRELLERAPKGINPLLRRVFIVSS